MGNWLDKFDKDEASGFAARYMDINVTLQQRLEELDADEIDDLFLQLEGVLESF